MVFHQYVAYHTELSHATSCFRFVMLDKIVWLAMVWTLLIVKAIGYPVQRGYLGFRISAANLPRCRPFTALRTATGSTSLDGGNDEGYRPFTALRSTAGNDEDEGVGEEDEDDEEQTSEMTGKEGSLRLKVRQHVNPLASRYQVPVALSADWLEQTFPSPKHPIIVDVGCAKGTWALKYARSNPLKNVLGLEIRRPVVELALRRKQVWQLSNCHFLATNANVDIKRILKDISTAEAQVEMITIHHPDPHFKKKHKKRQVVNDEFVALLAEQLPKGVSLFVQSDVLECAKDMVDTISQNAAFSVADGFSKENLDGNPAPSNSHPATEREIATKNKGLPVFRCLFRRI